MHGFHGNLGDVLQAVMHTCLILLYYYIFFAHGPISECAPILEYIGYRLGAEVNCNIYSNLC